MSQVLRLLSIVSLRLDNCDLGECDGKVLAALVTRLHSLDMEDVRWGLTS
jgi:hypothetical protein